MFRWITRVLDMLAQKDAELAAERAARAYLAQRLAELKLEHARELEESRRRLAVSQANFEWLTVSHNTLSAERAALMNLRTGAHVPAPEIVTSFSPDGIPGTAPERPLRRDQLPNLADLTSQGLSFDDVGDRDAAMLGLDEGGIYNGPASLLS